MKRCSQCDFIYEDDQHLCDMDGHPLVYEPTLQALLVDTPPAATKTTVRGVTRVRRVVLAVATAVLIGTVLSVGYSGFTSEYEPQNFKSPSTNVIRAPQSAPYKSPATPLVTPTPSPNGSPRVEKTIVRPTTVSPIAMSMPRPVEHAPVATRPTIPRREAVKSQSPKANHKKGSGFGGFLKKTGKILSKPFKF